jgi:calcium-dependent protein kinase
MIKDSYGQRRPTNYELQNTEFKDRICFEDVGDFYYIGKELGHGKYGYVRLVSKKSYPKKAFAMKTIPRAEISTDVQLLHRELEILMEVDHPNIVNFYEIYMDANFFHFII